MANQEQNKPEDRKASPNDPKPGEPKSAHKDYVSGGKNENKDSREELRKKH